MTATAQRSLMSELGLDSLTTEVRRQLLHELIDSLTLQPPAEDAEFSVEWQEELQRRIQNADEHPELGKSWESVEAALRSKVKCTN
jgi:putative addiction module component (TIGR02574 family)